MSLIMVPVQRSHVDFSYIVIDVFHSTVYEFLPRRAQFNGRKYIE
jgi:hypothetical protein